MLQKLNAWLDSVFRNSDINKLLAVGAALLLFLWFFAGEITPLFGGLLAAYLLEGGVQRLEKRGISRAAAATLTVLLTVSAVAVLLGLLPLFALQLRGVANDLPNIVDSLVAAAAAVDAHLPGELLPEEKQIRADAGDAVASAGKFLLDNSLGIAVNVFSLFLYLVLTPLLVFFLLKDKTLLLAMIQRYSPKTPIFGELWAGMDAQFGSYIRGKFIEAAVIGVLSWAAFSFWDLNYAFSLAALIGLSVFVPFVGAIAVTFPVLALAYIQFGASPEFWWIVGLYTVIQVLDGQVLVPLLFSEVVKLHPVAIFTAIIFFGNLWGLWGVFFAIPLASIIKTIALVIDARRAV
ncbi:MAG: AI-2E family transporter [Gammaproteobacteria bacterium]